MTTPPFEFPLIDWTKPVDLCAVCAFLVSRYGVEYYAPDQRHYPTHEPRLAVELLPAGTAGGAPGWTKLRSGPFPQAFLPMLAVATVAGTRVCGPHIGISVPDLGKADRPAPYWG